MATTDNNTGIWLTGEDCPSHTSSSQSGSFEVFPPGAWAWLVWTAGHLLSLRLSPAARRSSVLSLRTASLDSTGDGLVQPPSRPRLRARESPTSHTRGAVRLMEVWLVGGWEENTRAATTHHHHRHHTYAVARHPGWAERVRDEGDRFRDHRLSTDELFHHLAHVVRRGCVSVQLNVVSRRFDR